MVIADHSLRKVVLGLGNLLFSDEGFGIHALKHLQSRWGKVFPVEWVDGGVMGLSLLPLVEECSHLLVLDVLDAGQPSGSLIVLTGDEIPLYAGMKMSEHQIGFQEVLSIARFRGDYPNRLHLVGVQSGDLSSGVDLSPAVVRALPAAARHAVDVLMDWFSS